MTVDVETVRRPSPRPRARSTAGERPEGTEERTEEHVVLGADADLQDPHTYAWLDEAVERADPPARAATPAQVRRPGRPRRALVALAAACLLSVGFLAGVATDRHLAAADTAIVGTGTSTPGAAVSAP